ncbi:MAG: palindromic element RPE4 domain-containing protein [Rickettsia endosymbiont of Ecitomorpha arachnoides]|nr:palindromic element RPE4 domain-containing protein [Rickettsia endosymbiont of Ecitomorpha arachnoides]
MLNLLVFFIVFLDPVVKPRDDIGYSPINISLLNTLYTLQDLSCPHR